jgi:hypothetical protein
MCYMNKLHENMQIVGIFVLSYKILDDCSFREIFKTWKEVMLINR